MRQYRRELDQRQRDAEGLRQQLQRSGVPTQELNKLIDQLRELRKATLSQDALPFQQLQQQVVEGLKQFEYALRRQVEGGDREIFLSGSEDVPPGYRQMVEEYYRSLSRSGGGEAPKKE
jgi:predicted RNase H-like nuclease (RuvC/YqgF family)